MGPCHIRPLWLQSSHQQRMVAFIIKNPINPICLNSFTIKSRSALTSWRHFCKPRPWCMQDKCSNSQFQMANHRDRGIMGHNDVIVCVTVIKSDKCILFHRTGSILSNKSDRLDCWLMIMNATNEMNESHCWHMPINEVRRQTHEAHDAANWLNNMPMTAWGNEDNYVL